MNLYEMSATQAVAAIQAGEITSEELVQACLDQIAAVEDSVGAWQHLDPEYALQQAREADLHRRSGKSLGALHGVPVGVKDIFDTKDMPTEDGTELHAGRTPAYDATTVALLREAGAIIMGKTVTTELAVYAREYARTGFQASLNWYRCKTTGRFSGELELFDGRTIDVPSCFIAGASDWGIHQTAGAFEKMQAEALTDMRGCHLVDGAGHWVQQEQSEETARLLLAFLDR